jgi:hypothetical protein
LTSRRRSARALVTVFRRVLVELVFDEARRAVDVRRAVLLGEARRAVLLDEARRAVLPDPLRRAVLRRVADLRAAGDM